MIDLTADHKQSHRSQRNPQRNKNNSKTLTSKKGVLSAHHGLSLGIEGSDEVGRVLLLEPDSRAKRVTRIVLEYTSSGVVDKDQASLSAHVSKCQGSDHVGSNGLDLMRFAPIHVWTSRHTGGVKDMGGFDGGEVGLEGSTVLEATGTVLEVYTLGLAKLAEEASYPPGPAIDQKLVRFVAGSRRETHQIHRACFRENVCQVKWKRNVSCGIWI